MKRKMKQQGMDLGNGDLPLFSGTAIQVPEPRPDGEPAPASNQDQLALGACRVCFDTGVVKVGWKNVFCSCPAGQAAAEQARKAHPDE